MKKKFGILKLLLLCIIVGIVSAVPALAGKVGGYRDLNPSELESVSAYSGVINIWNVDTFEGGSGSKAAFLESCAARFSKANKGVYFLVNNLTVEEFRNNINSGVVPDLISFGFGIGLEIKQHLIGLSNNAFSDVRQEILQSGIIQDTVFALPYLMGGMVLISTEEKLAAAGKTGSESLLAVINDCGFDTKNKKGVVHTSSVVVGENEFVDVIHCLKDVAGGVGVSDVFLSPSGYDAYADFVSYNKGSILLGTHRDLFKISGRVAVGKVSGVKIEYLNGFTNLIQYIGAFNHLSGEKLKVSEQFIQFLQTRNTQELSTKIGMINVLGENFYESGEFMNLELALNQKLVVPNVFGI